MVHARANEIEILHGNKGNGKNLAPIVSVVNIIVAIIIVPRSICNSIDKDKYNPQTGKRLESIIQIDIITGHTTHR